MLLLFSGGGAVAEVTEGTYLDIRYNDLLLGGTEGGLNLRIVEGSQLLLNGRPCPAQDLPPGQPAYVDYDPKTGSVRRLEVVAPAQWSGSEDLFQVTLGHRYGDNPERPFRRGEVLKLQVRARSGQTIHCRVVGMASALKAREVRPGLYRCSLPVPDRLNLRHGYVYAGNGQEVIFGPSFQLAPTPPRILERGTLQGSLFIRFYSPGSWLKKATLWVDDRQVTGLQVGTDTVLSPPLDLPRGSHRVRWRLLDHAGNEVVQEYTFDRD